MLSADRGGETGTLRAGRRSRRQPRPERGSVPEGVRARPQPNRFLRTRASAVLPFQLRVRRILCAVQSARS